MNWKIYQQVQKTEQPICKHRNGCFAGHDRCRWWIQPGDQILGGAGLPRRGWGPGPTPLLLRNAPLLRRRRLFGGIPRSRRRLSQQIQAGADYPPASRHPLRRPEVLLRGALLGGLGGQQNWADLSSPTLHQRINAPRRGADIFLLDCTNILRTFVDEKGPPRRSFALRTTRSPSAAVWWPGLWFWPTRATKQTMENLATMETL